MSNSFNKFLKDVAWPAAAGNVAWSFATIMIDSKLCKSAIPFLLILFILIVYLSCQWIKNLDTANTPKTWGQLLELFLVISIVVFAISLESSAKSNIPTHSEIPAWSLFSIFLITTVGHLSGAWPPNGEGAGNIKFGLCSLIATFVVLFFNLQSSILNPWLILACLICVLIFWLIFRTNWLSWLHFGKLNKN